ncbi:MAG: hypothetical protein AB8B50_01060 [Pirellulaceae bacterium]
MTQLQSRDLQVWLLFFYGFGNACTYSLARTVADGTYLSRIGTGRLPELYLLSAGVVALAALLHAGAVRKTGLRSTIVCTLVGLSLTSVFLASLMMKAPNSLAVLTAGYFLAQIRGTLGTIQFATVLNEQFDSRGLKQVIGFIGFGATIAGFSMGAMVGVLSDYMSLESFLFIAAVLDLLTILPFVILRKCFKRHGIDYTAPPEPDLTQRKSFNWSPSADRAEAYHIRAIVSIVTLSIIAVTLVEYQWKVAAADWWGTDSVGMTKYFGFFYGSLYLVTGLLQLTLTERLMGGRKILVAVCALPSVLFLGAAGAISAATQLWFLAALTFCKFSDSLRRSLHDHAIQLAYRPLRKPVRRDAISFISGVVKPVAEATAGVAVVLLSPWFSASGFLTVILAICVVWLVAIRTLWGQLKEPPKERNTNY